MSIGLVVKVVRCPQTFPLCVSSALSRTVGIGSLTVQPAICHHSEATLSAQPVTCRQSLPPLSAQRHRCNRSEASLTTQRAACHHSEASLGARHVACHQAAASLSAQRPYLSFSFLSLSSCRPRCRCPARWACRRDACRQANQHVPSPPRRCRIHRSGGRSGPSCRCRDVHRRWR